MKINWRILSRLGLLLVIMGFCMPIQCDLNGFQLVDYAMQLGDNGMFAFGMYTLFFTALLSVIIGCVLFVQKVPVVFDWLLLIAGVISGLAIYFDDTPKLQYGAYVILWGWIITFICLLVHAGTGETENQRTSAPIAEQRRWEEAAAAVSGKTCAACGKKLEPEWDTCPFCGTKAANYQQRKEEAAVSKEAQNAHSAELSGAALERAQTAMSLGYGRAATIEALMKTGLSEQQAEVFYEKERTGIVEWRCKICGMPLKEGMAFCGGCGAKVEAKPPAAAPAPAAVSAAVSGDTCAACGKPVEAEWKVCPFCKAAIVRERRCGNCGKKLEPEWNACPFCGTETAWNSGGAALSGEALEKAQTAMSLGYGRAATIEALVKTGLSKQQAEAFYEENKGA
jgi:predicted amidophosphoribosyltransferase